MIKNIIYYNKALNKGKKFKIKFSKRIFYFYPWTNNLVEFYRTHNYLEESVLKYPKLLTKLNRPYLAVTFKISKKLKLIKDSYRFIDKYFYEEIKSKLYVSGKVKIGETIGKNNEKFKIFLLLYHACDKEGELQLVLVNGENIRVAKLTFSIYNIENEIKFFIGGIQGASNKVEANVIKESTKNLYGLRTQRIIIETLYNLEKVLNIKSQKIAVGKSQHIFNDKRYIGKHPIPLGYNEFWKSINAIELKEDLWKLPNILERKKIEEIASKKRSQYRKRYDLLNQCELSIRETFINSNDLDKFEKKEEQEIFYL